MPNLDCGLDFLFVFSLIIWLPSCHQKVIKWQVILFRMMTCSLKWSHYSLNTYSFWMRKVVIWWLFNEDLRARGWEPEKKETTNFSLLGYLILPYILFINMFCCTTNTCVLALLQKGGKRGNVKCKILLQKALEEN